MDEEDARKVKKWLFVTTKKKKNLSKSFTKTQTEYF